MELHLQTCEPGYFFSGGSCRDAMLLCCREGQLCCVVQGQPIALSAGEFLLLPSESWYMLFAQGDSAPVFWKVTFPMEQTGFEPVRSSDPLIEALITEATEQNVNWQAMCGHLLGQLLIQLQRRGAFLPAAEGSGECVILCRAQKIVSAHVREKINVPIMAKKAGISASYLTALFHKHLPFSPGEYIRRAKLEECRAMIREGALNFTQIAQMMEYSTVHQFSRQFKEVFGMTPSAYAKTVRP